MKTDSADHFSDARDAFREAGFNSAGNCYSREDTCVYLVSPEDIQIYSGPIAESVCAANLTPQTAEVLKIMLEHVKDIRPGSVTDAKGNKVNMRKLMNGE